MNLNAVNKTVTLLGRLFDPHKATEPYLMRETEKPIYRTGKKELPRAATPEEYGVSSRTLYTMLEAMKNDPTLHMNGITVLCRGTVLCEADFGMHDRDIWQYTFSECKSVVSLAVGILIGEGVLSLNDKIAELFSDRIPPVARLRLANLTLADVLTMRSGIVFNEAEAMTEPDWLKCWFGSAVSGEIGKTFHYNSMNTYLLSALVCRKSGMSLSAFLQKKLFTPLGIRDFYWETCPCGIEKGGWGLYMLPEDMAKLGCLVLNGGIWNGKRLLPADYLRAATTVQTETPDSYGNYGYGYQMWVAVKPHAFLFNGLFGQNVLGFFDNGILLVSNAGNDEMFQQSHYYRIVTDALGSVATGKPLPADAEGNALLKKTLARIKDSPSPVSALQKKPETAPVTQAKPEKRTFFARVNTLFAKKPTEPVPQSAPMQTTAPKTLPRLCETLDGICLVPSGGDGNAGVLYEDNAPSMGLLPVAFQVMENNYSKGFSALGFSVRTEDGKKRFYISYAEEDDTHVFAVGFDEPIRTNLYFHGVPYLVAVKGRCSTDEDGHPVLILSVDFLELPSSRTLKLYCLGGEQYLLSQEEQPGAKALVHTAVSFKDAAAFPPLVGGAIEKVDNDHITFLVKRIFAPKLLLEKKKRV